MPAHGWADGLSDREYRFVSEYLSDLNPGAAMQRVGMANQSCGHDYDSIRSARESARQLLAKPHVAKSVEAALSAEAITKVSVFTKWGQIFNADIADAYDEKDNLRPVSDMPEGLRAAITEFQFDKDGNRVGVKMADKVRSLDSVARALRMFVERVEHSGPDGGKIELSNPLDVLMADSEKLHEKLAEAKLD